MTDLAGDTSPPARRSTSRWVWIALLCSVAVNLALVGLAVGSIRHMRNAFAGGPGLAGSLVGFVQMLPPDRREQVRDVIANERPAYRAFRQDVRRARGEVFDAFLAEPFDKARLETAQVRLTEVEFKVRQSWGRLLAAAAPHLTLEERRAVLERGRQWRGRFPGKQLEEDEDSSKDAPKN